MKRILVFMLLLVSIFGQNALLGGKVVDESERGLSDLTIYVISYSMLFDSVSTDADGDWEMPITAPDSVFIFPALDEFDPVMIEPEIVELSVNPGDTISDINFVYSTSISLDASISGNVTFESGDPASGVLVISMGEDEEYYAETDASGNYVMFVTDGFYTVTVYYEAFECLPEYESVSISGGESIAGIDFTLYGEMEDGISGYVQDSYGEPMSDIIVIAESAFGIATSTSTDMGGFFSLAIEEGDWGIYVSTTEYSSSPERYLLEYFPGVPTTGYDFVLTPLDFDANISGRVSYDYGEPASYVEVMAVSDMDVFTTYTDYDGSYSLGVTEGSYELVVNDYYYIAEPASYSIDVSTGDDLTGYDFVLREYTPEVNAWISGRVTDGTDGLSGVYIYAYDMFFDYGAITDADGYYIIGVSGGSEVEVYCWEDGYIVAPEYYYEYVSVGDTLSGLDFLLTEIGPPDAYIEGNVTFSDGSPAPGQDIYAYSYWGYEYDAVTDAEGNYRLAVVGGTMYELYCDSWEYWATPEWYEVSIESGETMTGYDFVLGDFSYDLSIDVSVINMEGDGMPGIMIYLYEGLGSGSPIQTLWTDEDGYVSFSPEEPGMYTLRVGYYTTEPEEWTVTVDDESPSAFVEFTIIDEPLYRLYIFSVDSIGLPYPELSINWRYSEGHEMHEISTGMDGVYVMEGYFMTSFELFTLPEEGFYVTPAMRYILLNDANPTDSVTFTVLPVSGVDEAEKPVSLKLSAYPNPFNSSVEIVNPTNEPVHIYDTQGRLVDIVNGNTWSPRTESGTYMAKAGDQSIKLFYVR